MDAATLLLAGGGIGLFLLVYVIGIAVMAL